MSSIDKYTVTIGNTKYKYKQQSAFYIKPNDLLYIFDKDISIDQGIYQVIYKKEDRSNATNILFYTLYLKNTNTNENIEYIIQCDTSFAKIACPKLYLVTDVVSIESIESDDFTGKKDINELLDDKFHVVDVTYDNLTYRFDLYIEDKKIGIVHGELNNSKNLKKLKYLTRKFDGIIKLLNETYSVIKLSDFQKKIKELKQNTPEGYEIKYYYKQPISGGGKRQNKRYLRKTTRKNKNKRRNTKSKSKKQ